MAEKIFCVYLAKDGVPYNEAYAKLDLPASPWELWDAMEKVRLKDDEALYMEIDDYYAFEYLAPHLGELDISLNELNDLAAQLAALDEVQGIAFEGMFSMEVQKKVNANGGIITMQDMRDLAVSARTDCYHVVDAADDAALGRFYPSNACNTNITWSCSDSSVISMSNGVITAKNYGTATITAESFNGKKNSIKITVKEITADKVVVSGLPDLNDHYIGDAFVLASQIVPENVDDPSIVWSSSNDEIATVSSSGSVQLLSAGKVEIRATASNGVSGKVGITVKEKYVETVDIAEDEIDALLGDEIPVAAVVSPSDATYPELVWASEDPAVASVSDDGKISALACGETVITATSTNGIHDSVTVRISEIKASSLEIDGPDSILLGETATLSGVFVPANTTDQRIEWSVNNPSVASVSDEGVLTTKNAGTATITATQKDVSAVYTIEVLPIDVEEIIITASAKGAINKEDTIELYAEVLPQNATYPEITWSVSNPEIASIDENGVLTALKGGTVTVIATSADGFSSEYEVRVSSPLAVAIGAAGVAGVGAAVFATKKKKNSK